MNPARLIDRLNLCNISFPFTPYKDIPKYRLNINKLYKSCEKMHMAIVLSTRCVYSALVSLYSETRAEKTPSRTQNNAIYAYLQEIKNMTLFPA